MPESADSPTQAPDAPHGPAAENGGPRARMNSSATNCPWDDDKDCSVDKPTLLRGIASLTALTDAYKDRKQCPSQFEKVSGEFVRVNGEVVDSYFTTDLRACAVVVSKRGWRLGSERRRLLVRLDRRELSFQAPEFNKELWRTLWMARLIERESEFLLSSGPRRLLNYALYSVAVFLLSALDAAAQVPSRSPDEARSTLLAGAATSARRQLDKLEAYAKRSGIATAIRIYLLGMPVGAAILAVPVATLYALSSINATVRDPLVLTIVAGGIGSVASVMFRITRGQRLEVNTEQGSTVTLIGGMFRPLIGAVFGVALYILVVGDLLPLDTGDGGEVMFFYAGLAFLAGFSERWAQDTILRSTPVSPSEVKATSNLSARAERARQPDPSGVGDDKA